MDVAALSRGTCWRVFPAVLAVLTVVLLAACGPGAVRTQPEETTASGGYPVTVTDSVGRRVTIESEPRRIASMAPSLTETVFALGEGEKVVGVTTADDYPPEVRELPKIGDFQQVNVEKVLELDADLLLVSFEYSTRERAEELEEETGADVVVVNPKNLKETTASMELVGRAVGAPERSERLRERLEMELREISEAVEGRPRPTVFYELWHDPLQTVGPGSFIHDAIVLAGGRNIAASTEKPYPTYSTETLIKKDPDYYLVGSTAGVGPEELEERPGYPALSAVRRGNVVVVNDDLITRPGPRIAKGVREIAEAIHPEAFER
ncbi:ABC transporter substrate-binding protein [Rubrobacter xylanophilus]|uniref:ABC transporter substrate-binding protein n=1 Tax=Rubrobacter xylanophilus TaxID=49319 RepID=UPI001C63EDD4|nr:ABC transporter substrate-binding protein [Rubrobacter xylanophilus]